MIFHLLSLVLSISSSCVAADMVVPGMTRLSQGQGRAAPVDTHAIIFPGDEIPEYDDYDYDNTDVNNSLLPLVDDFDKLNVSNLMLLNNLQTIDDIAAALNIQLPKAEPVLPQNVSIVSRAGVEKKSKRRVKAKPAGCEPTLSPVELDLRKQPNTLYIPTCVRLQRCGGCCVGSTLSCQPTDTEEVELEVLKINLQRKTSSSRGFTRRGRRPSRRRRSTPEFIVKKEVNHISCACQCKVKEEHCDPKIHVYLKSDCKCLCLNKDEERKCLKQNVTHFWDSSKCQCICRDSHECSSGQHYNHKNCRCESPEVHIAGRSGGLNNQRSGTTSG